MHGSGLVFEGSKGEINAKAAPEVSSNKTFWDVDNENEEVNC